MDNFTEPYSKDIDIKPFFRFSRNWWGGDVGYNCYGFSLLWFKKRWMFDIHWHIKNQLEKKNLPYFRVRSTELFMFGRYWDLGWLIKYHRI